MQLLCVDYMSDTLTDHGGQAVFDGVSRDRDAEPPVSKHLVLKSGFVLPSELLPQHVAQSAHEPLTDNTDILNTNQRNLTCVLRNVECFCKIRSSLFIH